MYPWTLRLHFWQACRNLAAKKLTVLNSYSKSDEKKCNFPKKFRQKLLWTRRIHFWQPCRYFFAKGPKCFPLKYEIDEKFYTSPQINFPQIGSLNTQIAFSTSLPNIFEKELDKHLQIKNGKEETNVFLQEKSSKLSLLDVNCGSDNPVGLFLPKVRTKFAQNVEVEKK